MARELGRQFDVIECAGVEREEARVGLLHDGDLDALEAWQLCPGECIERLAVGRVAGLREAELAKGGISREHDPLPAPPRFQRKRAGADRVVHRPAVVVGVALDHLTRDRRHRARAEIPFEDVIGIRELDADRVPVERRETRDRRVVVEAPGRFGGIDHRVGADHLALQVPRERRADFRVEEALPRVDEIGGNELARLAVKRGIVGEANAGAHAKLPDPSASTDLGHRRRGERHATIRPRKVVEAEQWLEDRALDVVGIEIARRLRIEARLGFRERNAQRRRTDRPRRRHLVARRRSGTRSRGIRTFRLCPPDGRNRRERGEGGDGAPP